MTGRLALSVDASAVPRQPGGAGRYVLELVAALRRQADVEVTVLCRRGDASRWTGPDGAATVVDRAPTPRPARLVWEQLGLPRLLAAGGYGVHHGPHYTMPERARLPKVVTVHDLTFFDHPEWHERSKASFFRRAIRVAAARADAVVVVSQTTAERLVELLSPRTGVHVVPHGVDHARFHPRRTDDGDDAGALRHVGVSSPYVLFVGTLEPRKDVPSLVTAFDRIAAGQPELALVLAGADGWGTGAVDAAIAASGHRHRIRRIGYVSEQHKAALLRGAVAVAYPSRVEGFGLPALEAMASGAPLVTTAGTAMAEVAGDAALLVPPGDVDALAEALEAVAHGGPDVEGRREKGVARASLYTWDASAAGHVTVYRHVA